MEQKTNLAAAAPDLLEALKNMLVQFGNQRFKVRKDFSKMVAVVAAQKAVEKAEQ